ncbi:hypothetical protein LL13F55_31850 [Escherichia coli]
MKIFSITPDRKNTTTGGGVSLGRLYLIRAIAFLSAKSASSVISRLFGNDSNLLIVFYVQIMPDDFVMQLHRF